MAAIFTCCIRRSHSPDSSQPTETTHLLNGEQGGPSTPIISHQPEPLPPPEVPPDQDPELEQILSDMIGTMVRPKAANPFLTGEGHTPSTSRNPSPRSQGTSSRGANRSLSRGRTGNAFQVRRVRIGRNGQSINGDPPAPSGSSITAPGRDALQEEADEHSLSARPSNGTFSGTGVGGGGEGEGAQAGDGSSVRTGGSDAPTRVSTQTREELERQKYTVRLKTKEEVVRPWKSQITGGE